MPYRPDRKVELKGKRILITGASSGIGEAAAIKFARLGATVVVVARRKDLLDNLAQRAGERQPGARLVGRRDLRGSGGPGRPLEPGSGADPVAQHFEQARLALCWPSVTA